MIAICQKSTWVRQKMKVISALLLLSATYFMSFAALQNNPREAILKVLSDQAIAWNNGDIEGYMQGYWQSDSLMFIGKRGITKGWKNTLDNYKKSYPDKATMGTLTFNIVEVELLNEVTAHVIGKWELQRNEDKGNLSGHFTLIVKKINQSWVIISDHTS